MHLVQEEDLIRSIHEKEIPPDEYYVKLKEIVKSQHPKVADTFIDHAIAVAAAFDTASALGCAAQNPF